MNNYFELTLKHLDMESKFTNCSIDNVANILQTDMYMRGLDIVITTSKIWDIVLNNNCADHDLNTLLDCHDIIIKPINPGVFS